MAYVKENAPSKVYHLTKKEKLNSILEDGRIRRFGDTECWFCTDPQKMKAYMEQTVMCEGKPYYAVGGQLCRYPKFVPEDYIILMERGLILKKGTIVDSTIISAPSSTKNKEKKRDPDAHQVKKGNTWHFGYKAHIGVDRDSGLVHTVEATAANVHDATETSKLLTGDEDEVYGDSGYLGAEKRGDAIIRNKAGRKIKYRINRRPSQVKKLSKSGQYAAKKAEHAKSSVRAKVEHAFGVVKKQLRFRKTRYRGLEKQRAKFNIMFALANLILADRPCLAA